LDREAGAGLVNGVLVQLTKAVQLLAQARTFEDVLDIRSFATAAEAYARAEKLGDEAEQYARDIRVRAARKAGELLREMAVDGERQAKGRPPENVPEPTHLLADLGITRKESSRWQKLAAVPDEEFERLVAEGKGEEAITRSTRSRATNKPKKPKAVAPRAKTNGYTLKQSLRGLQQAAMQIQGLAEALDGQMLGDWSRLYDEPDAQPWFDAIEQSLPVLAARLKRVLRERGRDVADRDIG